MPTLDGSYLAASLLLALSLFGAMAWYMRSPISRARPEAMQANSGRHKVAITSANLKDNLIEPAPGPVFGHFLTKKSEPQTPSPNPGRRCAEVRTGRPSTPGYQTPAMRMRTPPSADFSSLARTAPRSYANLQLSGMLDENGTPTKKWMAHQQDVRRTLSRSDSRKKVVTRNVDVNKETDSVKRVLGVVKAARVVEMVEVDESA